MTHTWWWRSRLPERKGQACRVVARGAMNSILVEFADGYRVVTSRYAVRRLAAAIVGMALALAVAGCNVAGAATAHMQDAGAADMVSTFLPCSFDGGCALTIGTATWWTPPSAVRCKRGHFASPINYVVSWSDGGGQSHTETVHMCPLCWIDILRRAEVRP